MGESYEERLKLLKHPDVSVRRDAVMALGSLGQAAAPAVPALIETLGDKMGHVRMAAAEALGQIGKEASAAIPALRAALQDKNGGVQYAAGEALKRIEAEASGER